jgi:UDP-N-acetylglucosamine 2-epimerase (non-hydrolysing)
MEIGGYGASFSMPSNPFLLVAGARPNFMKVAPIARVFRKRGIPFKLLNTGQHHDPGLSAVFLKELGLGRPDYSLEVGSGSHAFVTARVLERSEPILQKIRPRGVIVVGDVNSTLAMALAATKLHLPVAHVEAGLRSRDRLMPEETNRILTDLISDLLLTPSADADQNLRMEGIPSSRIARVGNVMIDSLVHALRRSPQQKVKKSDFFLMTFHRPSNVDNRAGLQFLIRFLKQAAAILPVRLPIHPRTRVRLESFGLWKSISKIPHLHITEPMGYFEFVSQMRQAKAVVTDSGGIQEETSYLGVPCLIMRTTTERPVCIKLGTAELMGEDYTRAVKRLKTIMTGQWKKPKPIPLWDGKTADRIVSVLLKKFK